MITETYRAGIAAAADHLDEMAEARRAECPTGCATVLCLTDAAEKLRALARTARPPAQRQPGLFDRMAEHSKEAR